MNLNTLNNETVTSKTGKLAIALYPNKLREGTENKAVYYARVINRSRMGMEDIADDIVSHGCAEKKEDILKMWKTIDNAVICRLAEGMPVSTGLGVLRPSVTGSFESASSEFDKSRNRITVQYRPDRQLTEIMESLTPVISLGNSQMPEIIDAVDKTADSDEDGILRSGGFFSIRGKNILVAEKEDVSASDSTVGLYFVNVADDSKTVRLLPSQIYHNSSALLEGIIPELESGTYRIRVVTRIVNGTWVSNTVREHTFEKEFTVI